MLILVILAGGQGSRLGGVDKGLLETKHFGSNVSDERFVERLLRVVTDQQRLPDQVVINANQNRSTYTAIASRFQHCSGIPTQVMADVVVCRHSGSDQCQFGGPLQGMASVFGRCMDQLASVTEFDTTKQRMPSASRLVSWPVDAWHMPDDYLSRMVDLPDDALGVAVSSHHGGITPDWELLKGNQHETLLINVNHGWRLQPVHLSLPLVQGVFATQATDALFGVAIKRWLFDIQPLKIHYLNWPSSVFVNHNRW